MQRQAELTNGALFHALVEHLKLPLLQITRSAEMAGSNHSQDDDLTVIQQAAQSTLRLIDCYIMSLQLQNETAVELQPVSVAAIFQQVAHRLAPIARRHDCDLGVDIGGRYGPVLAEPKILESMLMILGSTLIEADSHSEQQRRQVIFGVHRSRYGLVAGAYTNQPGLGVNDYRRATSLIGRAGQLLPSMSANNGVGIFVASCLSDAMHARLRPSRHAKLAGLATILTPSHQLQLV